MPDTCWHLLPAGEKMLGGPQARPIPIVTQYSPRRHQAMRYFCTQYICSALIPHVLCSLSELNSDLGHTHAFDWSRKWQPTLVFLPGEFHGQRSLAGYSPWGCKESDMTEQLSLTDAFNEIPTPYLCPSCLRPPQLRPPAKASGSSAAPF